MASVNKVILLGNVGKDPEIRYMPNGDAACSLSLATTRSWKNKESGERQEETEWHRVTFFQRLAEIVGEYVKRGSPLYVEGRLRTRKYQDKDGKDTYATEIVAESMQLLGSRDDAGGQQRQAAPAQRQAAPQQRQAPAQRQPARGAGSAAGYGSAGGADDPFGDMDSSIPF